METIDVVIIGAGVTGLACARSVAERGHSVCLIERHPRPGAETSTHNSGVIHAGMYYPAGTLKTRLCVEGRPLLYEFCRAWRIEHRQSAATTPPPLAAAPIELPAGARIETIGVGSDRLVLNVVLPDDNRQLLLIDLATGRRLATIPLRPSPPNAPAASSR